MLEIILLITTETFFFLLVYLFLIFERTYSILGILGGFIVASIIINKIEGLNDLLRKSFSTYRTFAVLYGIIFVIAMPFLLRNYPYQIFILFNAGLFALLALGLNWQIGSTNIVNFATGASFATGAYTTALLATHLGLSFWVLLPIGGLAAAAIGFILGLPCMKTKTYYLSLVTIAFTLIVYLLLNNFSWTGGPDGIADIPFPKIGNHSFGSPIQLFGFKIPFQANFYYLAVCLVAVTFLVDRRLRYSRLGLAWNAIRTDEVAAECQGINVTYSKVLSFSLNFFFDGIAGTLFAFCMSHISPESFTFNVSVTAVAIVIVGGLDNAVGVLFGSLLMTLIPEKFQVFQDYRMLIFGFIILIMLLLRPKGLFPQSVRKYE